jgi:hypothetical protein
MLMGGLTNPLTAVLLDCVGLPVEGGQGWVLSGMNGLATVRPPNKIQGGKKRGAHVRQG